MDSDKIDSDKTKDAEINSNNTEHDKMNINKIETIKHENSVGKISIKKSTFRGLTISLVAVSLIAAFFAGSYTVLKSEETTKIELNDSIKKLESKILRNQPSNLPDTKPIRVSIDDDPIKGSNDAPITIVEFSDFQCPFCSRFHIQTFPLILKEYVDTGKVKFVYRDFPIQSSHPNAIPAAAASECAHEQNNYWEYHNALFERQTVWNNLEISDSINTFKKFAIELGLNEDQFNSCLDSGKYIEEINKDLKDGTNYGITGTPGFLIGNEKNGFVKLTGAQPFEAFKKIIDSQLST
ncbi:MAG: DsbA family protein [Nitrosarchaeum sp.]|nr:DsbA family protein [Nitrosarchaeum sp.]